MTAANLDYTDLAAADRGGLVREEVMEKIWLIDKFPLILTDMLSSTTSGNQLAEFTTDELGAAVTTNKVIDGADIDQDDSVIGERMGNYHQTAVKEIQISTRANASNSIGRQGSLSYQVSRGQQRLRRDVEAQMCTSLASVAGDGTAVAGQSAGIGAWIKTNIFAGVGYVAGGWDAATGLIDAPTAGTAEALTETNIRDVAQLIYEEGGNTSTLMATPTVIRLMSSYLFGDTARVATMTNDNAEGTMPMKSYGSTNVFITDFDVTLNMVANRLQPVESAGESIMYFLDSSHLWQSFMTGYRTEPLAKTGLSEKRLICVDYSLLVTNEKSQGAVKDIDETTPMLLVAA